ncbi:hypothetical protein NFI96_027950, partial [Prochilodus magdalenae]
MGISENSSKSAFVRSDADVGREDLALSLRSNGLILIPMVLRMRYVAAYLLAALGGKENPSASDIKKILESVGIEVDSTRMDKVVSELSGKKVEDVIAQGYGKLASMPAGGAVAVATSAAPSAGGAAAPAAAAAEEKKEEKKEESEESDDDMGFGLTPTGPPQR